MPKMIFVNLPVRDLAASTRFYEAIGCERNPRFSDEKAASMVWSDEITFQLLTRAFFSTFTSRPIADAHGTCGALFALTLDSRDDVDAVVKAAALAGGKADVRERMDFGWLYNRAVEDPDGNVVEAVWMDAAAMTAQTTEQVVEHA
jgi:predicted lactoylglutathione lyase